MDDREKAAIEADARRDVAARGRRTTALPRFLSVAERRAIEDNRADVLPEPARSGRKQAATPSQVVVGVDASDESLPAVRWAADEAARQGKSLTLLHSCVFDNVDPAHGAGLGGETELVLEHVHRWLERAADIVRSAHPQLAFEERVELGMAPDRLAGESATASLLVLGSHGLSGVKGAVVGSVALRVAATARCPVVVVRGQWPVTGPVVVGVDADNSDHALEFALDAAAVRRVPLVVLHAWHDHALSDGRLAAVAARERSELEALVTDSASKYPDLLIEPVIVEDRDPARALMRAASDAQLIVVGSRGRGPVAGALLGSTGNALLGHAACPVAVVH